MEKRKRHQVIVRLEDGMYEWLRRTAFKQRRPMSQVILEALGKLKEYP